MVVTSEQREAMLQAAKPLIKWLNDNCHPHCRAVVDHINIELVGGIATHGTEQFLKE
jgi:hypothetical protein